MDKKQSDIIFFLPYWDIKNPTLEGQTGFMLSEMFEVDECRKIGDKVFSSNDYYMKEPKEFIREVIRKDRPKWVIGIENTATILISYKRQKKILINPTVTLNDLNWVTPETIRDTYAFFSADYEADYEMYSRVYKNVAFYPSERILFISDIKTAIEGILSEG
ncbi:MAG: hypothetical protein K2F94_03795 [Muribaculaceae bacterium]|nr:hypothetical protein [Muribaculaceae bacterium]